MRLLTSSIDGVQHLDTPQARQSLRAQARYFFRQTTPLLLLVNGVALLGVRAVVGAWSVLDVAVLVVTAAWWPFQEWLFHKFLLHMKPRTVFGFKFDPLFSRSHRAHHRQPWIVDKTLLPAVIVVSLIPIQPLIWCGLFQSWSLGLTAAATYAFSALLYEWIHYLCHSHYVPRSAYYRRIWKNHRLHHFKNENYWFSFTVPHVDSWMGTDPPAESVSNSETVKTLGVDDA